MFYLSVFVEHTDLLGPCPEDEAISPGDECMDAVLDESLLETCPIQSPLQVFAGMGGLALIAERLPMLYPDVIQQVSEKISLEKHANNFLFVQEQYFPHISVWLSLKSLF